jgi:RHH-type proline utilization regulon transcriptional repressor/proline dehydrogenase/delta 1-pyrroline-5-carboxylate dehydrogenase
MSTTLPHDGAGGAELDDVARRAGDLAEALLAAAAAVRRPWGQRRREALLASLVDDPAAKRFAFHLTDRVARAADPAVAADQLRRLIAREGSPAGLPAVERAALRVAAALAPRAPRLVMPLVQARLRDASRGVVIDAAPRRLHRHLHRRRAEGSVSNVNVLGEAILGEEEAADRLARVLAQLRSPDVSYVSVKLSSVASNLSVLAFDETVERLGQRLRPLYLAAAEARPAKFVNLDMEEYRDLPLTLATFRRILGTDEPRLRGLEAGIVLQAYLPDSADALAELGDWAAQRVASGGAGIKVRLVKGANLAMEAVEAELHGWQQAPYGSKAEVDANYKRLVERALRPEHARAVRVGVASHNLFDVCFALVLAADRGVADRLDIEMLEGMADAQAAVVRERADGLVLYTPVAARRDFSSAIAYLTRRLDENTSPQNYLAHLHRLADDPAARAEERARFVRAVHARDDVSTASRRDQRRPAPTRGEERGEFRNAADTDFAVAANRDWLQRALAQWRPGPPPAPPSSVAEVDAAVARAVDAAARWSTSTGRERRRLLDAVADSLEAARGDAIAAMVGEAGKVVGEADVEVSEAVDFARYYGAQAVELETVAGMRHRPFGVVAVVSPWNFPYAIPAGGVLAALAAGNAVILKPAPQTMGIARLLVERLWHAGVDEDLVQLLAAPEDERGRRLITHPDVAAVVLTGSTGTAELFLGWRPDLRLHAETSGKNAIVVSATADVDQAVSDVVRSAFGHAGQKCSATSLAIVDRRVLDRGAFLRQLRDAVESLPVGPTTDLANVVGPLIEPPGEALRRAFTRLDAHESWLVEPRPLGGDDRSWRPGVRTGVAPGSWFHQTECFGPVLGVMRADSLEQATRWQNRVAFGLTGGLESLDDDEIAWWVDHVEVGNAYVNRPTTGAIVRRQPFGGWKRSVVGPGAKAGGPGYVASLGTWEEVDDDADVADHGTGVAGRGRPDKPKGAALLGCVEALATVAPGPGLARVAADYEGWWERHFARDHDPSALASERNRFRYRPLAGPCVLRVASGTPAGDTARAVLAAVVAGSELVVSGADDAAAAGLVAGRHGIREVTVEGEADLAARLRAGRLGAIGRLRLLGNGPAVALRDAARDLWLTVLDDRPAPSGQVELGRWLREQTVSETRHRYGNPW